MSLRLDAFHISFPTELSKYMLPAWQPADDFPRHVAYVYEACHSVHEGLPSSDAPVWRHIDYVVRCSIFHELFCS